MLSLLLPLVVSIVSCFTFVKFTAPFCDGEKEWTFDFASQAPNARRRGLVTVNWLFRKPGET